MHYSIVLQKVYIVFNKKIISYFSSKTYVVGTQKNRLNETVLLSNQTYVKTGEKENIYNFTLKNVYFCCVFQMIDALLNSITKSVHSVYNSTNPDFTWLSVLLKGLTQYSPVVMDMFRRIWVLIFTQVIEMRVQIAR